MDNWNVGVGMGLMVGIGFELVRATNRILKLQKQQINLFRVIYSHQTGKEAYRVDPDGDDDY